MQPSSSNSSNSSQITYCSMDPLKDSSTFSVHVQDFEESFVNNHENKIIIGGHYVVRKREIWFVGSAVVFFVLCVILSISIGVSIRKTDSDPERPDHAVPVTNCNRPQCYQLSSHVIHSLNQSVDICQNFGEFVCGNLSPLTIVEETFEKIDEKLKLMLETSTPNFKSDDHRSKVKTFYQACVVDAHGVRQKGIPLLNIIDRIGGWNALGDWDEKKWQISSVIQTLTCDLLLEIFFSTSIAPDKISKNKNHLKLSMPSHQHSSTWSNQFWEAKEINAYKELLNSTASLLMEDKMKSNQLTINHMQQKLSNFVADVVDMENRFYQMATDETAGHLRLGPKRQPSITIEVQIRQLYQYFPFLSWVQCLNAIVPGAEMTNVTVIDVDTDALDFLRQMALQMQFTPKRSLNNFLVWRIVKEFLPFLTLEYQQILANYQQTLTNTDRIPSIEKHCLQMLKSSILRGATMSLVVNNENSSLTQIKDMISSIRKTLLRQPWLTNNEILKKSNEKVKRLNIFAENEFLIDSQLVDEFYAKLQVTDNLFNNVLAMRHFIRQKLGAVLTNPTAVAPFLNSDQYLLDANETILIPCHYLSTPFYDSTYPLHVIYGRLGTTIAYLILKHTLAQELVSSVDQNFDTSINYLWDCANEIIGRLKIKGIYSGQAYEYNIRSNENYLIRLLAVKVAFESYRSYLSRMKTDLILPGLETYSLEQAFFISAFQINCEWADSHYEYQVARQGIATGTQQINMYTKIFQPFNLAFNCPQEDDVKYTEKCSQLLTTV